MNYINVTYNVIYSGRGGLRPRLTAPPRFARGKGFLESLSDFAHHNLPESESRTRIASSDRKLVFGNGLILRWFRPQASWETKIQLQIAQM